MTMSDKFWNEVSPSSFEWERDALRFLREGLPNHEPWRVWSNFQFIARDGSVNEVDALVLGKLGCFLVEIKSHRGVVTGDQRTLRFQQGAGPPAIIDHPHYLANLKSKRLKSLLQGSKTFGRGSRIVVPFIEPLIFLSHASGSELDAPADSHVVLRDRDATEDRPGRPGVLAALCERRAPGLRPQPITFGDRPLAKAMEKAFADIGLAAIPARRRVKDYELETAIEETGVWRDDRARHASLSKIYRRVRRYFHSPGSPIERHQVEEAAKREFELLERLEHPGILRATDFTMTEHGPAIFFDDTEGLVRLDRFLAEHGDRLATDDRLKLVRDIAEAVAYAHRAQIVHRCLSPLSVLVAEEGGKPQSVKVMNWQSGTRGEATTTRATYVQATLHPESYQDQAASVYLAPELRRDPSSIDPTLDVFSLGAIAYLVFAGAPPAETPEDLYEAVRDGGLTVSAVVDGTIASIDHLVSGATHPLVSKRFGTVGDFLAAIDLVEDELTEPDTVCRVPADAHKGDVFPDGTRVKQRLGSGGTAVAFLVERPTAEGPEECVLKVARDPEHSGRIVHEGEIVSAIQHDHIARFVGPFELSGYAGFFTRPANDQTLRQRLEREGPLQLELLERFGGQLLDAVAHLESIGIAHRDIKPDNIAVTSFERRQALGLVLFDFSLSGSPVDNLRIGTPPYTDPFLEDRPNRRWDLQAERFSLAMTLHEMATGVLPTWGDGRSDPRATSGEVVLDGNRFPGGARDALLRFFAKALARDPGARFDHAEAMRVAWDAAFQGTQHAPVTDAPDDVDAMLAERLAALGSRTPVSELPLSTRAANALDRLELFVVEDLLRMPTNWMFSVRGVGAKTRGELEALVRSLRVRFPDISIDPTAVRRPTAAEPDPVDVAHDPAAGVDEIVEALRSGGTRLTDTQTSFMDVLLGLDADADAPLVPLPSQTEAGDRAEVSRQRIAQVVARLRAKWRAHGVARAVADQVGGWLDRHGGILTLDEAAAMLIAERGCAREGRAAQRLARAVMRAVSESECQQEEPRWHLRRRDDRQYLAATDDHLRYAELLAQRAEGLAGRDPLPGRAEVERALEAVARPQPVAPLAPGRLVRLAASAASGIALSTRGELYPVGLPAERAVRLSVGALVGAGERRDGDARHLYVTPADVEARIRRRYPAAAPLPEPAVLEGLLNEAGWEVSWSASDEVFRVRSGDVVSVASGSTLPRRFPTQHTTVHTPTTAEEREAAEFEERVRDVLAGRGFLILKTEPRLVELAAEELQRRFPDLVSVDFDERFTSAVDAKLAALGVKPDLFLTAEASGPANPATWLKVKPKVIDVALREVAAELGGASEPVLLRHVGLLARYHDWSPLEQLNALQSGRSPRACLVLIPGDTSTPAPVLDGVAIPRLGDAQVAVIPLPWMQNLLRAAAS